MRSFCVNCKSAVIALGAAACFVIAVDGSVCAQGINPRATGASRRAEKMQRQNEEYERDNLEREMATGPHRPSGRRNEAATAQVKQDFEKLQTSYNRIVLAMASRQGLNRDAVLEDVAEVKKTASRLKAKLALPKSEDDERKEALNTEGLTLANSLLKFRKHIYDFLTNPLFDTPAIYKIEEAKKAAGDLDKIIEVGDGIAKHADRTQKIN